MPGDDKIKYENKLHYWTLIVWYEAFFIIKSLINRSVFYFFGFFFKRILLKTISKCANMVIVYF